MALLTSNKIKAPSLHALLQYELKDLYDAEHQILDALPGMAKEASDADLKRALEDHKTTTETQITRLEDCFNLLEEKPARETCDGMKGIIKEGDMVLKGDMEQSVKDHAIIAAAQRVEHYEMAGYRSAQEHANHLGFSNVAELLGQTMKEEEDADKALMNVSTRLQKEVMKNATTKTA